MTDALTFYTYNALIQRIIDADTVAVDIDCGLDIWLTAQHMRLAHINAPELPTEAGKTATAYLAEMLGPLPAPVVLQTIKDRQDKYGRYLGVFFTTAGVNVNEAMVTAGHAMPYEGVGPRPVPMAEEPV